ncbi:hypothetical protein GCM10011504_03790 [Siccirubricoccus deserti]|nr:hypothetical protein GCM10011504_03790 [Siccirubricoccus deserti]
MAISVSEPTHAKLIADLTNNVSAYTAFLGLACDRKSQDVPCVAFTGARSRDGNRSATMADLMATTTRGMRSGPAPPGDTPAAVPLAYGLNAGAGMRILRQP